MATTEVKFNYSAFSEQSWANAKAKFQVGLKKADDIERADRLFNGQDSVKEAQNMCEEANAQSERQYSSKGSFTVGGHEVLPRSIVSKLLRNIDNFVKIGDVALQGGPESAGLVWMGIKIVLSSVQKDFSRCTSFADTFSDIVGIFISCRLYAKLYGSSLLLGGDSEVQERVRSFIPVVYNDIIDFTFYVQKYLSSGKFVRVVKGTAIWNTQSHDFEGKAASIRDHHSKMAGAAQEAWQESAHDFQESARSDFKFMREIVGSMVEQLHKQQEERKKMKMKTPLELAQDKFGDLSKSLNSEVDMKEVLKTNHSKRGEGTCRWIFDCPSYKEWSIGGQNNMLLVLGEPGVGKSTLLSAIVKNIEGEIDSKKTVMQYFFFKTGNDDTQLSNSAVQNMLLQLYTHVYESSNDPSHDFLDVLQKCNTLFESDSKERGLGTSQNSPGGQQKPYSLYQSFQKYEAMMDIVKKEVILIIDALDECSDTGIWELIQFLTKFQNNQNIHLKAIVSSRRNAKNVPGTLYELPIIRVQDHNEPDIKRYLAYKLAELPDFSQSEIDLAVERIIEKADGLFSYIPIAIEFLRQPWIRPLSRRLEKLPPGGEEGYKREFELIHPDYIELTKTCITWVLLGEGDVRVEEIMDAYTRTFLEGKNANLQLPLEESRLSLYKEQVRKAGGSFLDITNLNAIKLSHPSVRDFFLGEENCAGNPNVITNGLCPHCGSKSADSKPFLVSEKGGHLALATTILEHLNTQTFQQRYILDGKEESNDQAKTQSEPITNVNDKNLEIHDRSEQQASLEIPDHVKKAEVEESVNSVSTSEPAKDILPSTTTARNDSSDSVIQENIESATQSLDITVEGTLENGRNDDDVDDESVNLTDITDHITDNEDDFEQLDGAYFFSDMVNDEEINDGKDSMKLRYEVTHWPFHVKEAERLWAIDERKQNDDWKKLWRLLEQFCENTIVFHTWQHKQWQSENIPIGMWNSNDSFGPLHVAVAYGLKGLVTLLIERGSSVSSVAASGETPLHIAAQATNINLEIIELLFQKGADANVISEQLGLSPFGVLLIFNPTAEAVQLFLSHGADCGHKDQWGQTPMHYLTFSGKDGDLVTLMRNHGGDLNVEDARGETPLHILLIRPDIPISLLLSFLENGADVSVDNNLSQQPLFDVAIGGNAEAAKLLLRYHADILDDDKFGMTALHMAAYCGHTAVVDVLVAAEAPLNKPDLDGRTPFYLACEGGHSETAEFLLQKLQMEDFENINKLDKTGKSPLRKAARHGLTKVVELLIEKMTSASQLDIVDSGTSKQTALHVAAYLGHYEVVSTLLKAEAQIDIQDAKGRTPLTLCLDGWSKGSRATSELTLLDLIKRDPKVAIMNKDLMCTAAMQGSTKVLRELLQHHADPNQKDEHGWTPLLLAIQYGHSEAAELLAKKGAEIGIRPGSWAKITDNVRVSRNGQTLEYVYAGHRYHRESVLTDHPIPAGVDNYYFEIEIQRSSGSTNIPFPLVGIGLSAKPPKLWSKPYMPGWQSQNRSWGYHGDDGKLFRHDQISASGISKLGYKPYGPGDTIGCGISFKEKTIFYTRNGQPLGVAFKNVSGRLYPTVGMGEKVTVKANFGEDTDNRPFQWVPGNNRDLNFSATGLPK